MYGQTNCWALPEGDYGAYQGRNNEIYIMAARCALRGCLPAFQHMPIARTAIWGES